MSHYVHSFTPEDWQKAHNVAAAFEKRAGEKGYKSFNGDAESRLRNHAIGQLGEIAVARVSGAHYRGDRDEPRMNLPGDVGFVEVHTSEGYSDLILTTSDEVERSDRPFIHVAVNMEKRLATITGWELAAHVFKMATPKKSKFNTNCWYWPPAKQQPPGGLLFLLGRWASATKAWGSEPTVPVFMAKCERLGYQLELAEFAHIYGDELFHKKLAEGRRVLGAK